MKRRSVQPILAVVALSLMLFISGCSSYVRPNKVERIISKDSWRVTQFNFNGQDQTALFANKTLGFGESGEVLVLPSNGESGSWTVGLNKKPTLLYIQGFTSEPFFFLNDDWTVVEASNSRIRLESQVGSLTNTMVLLKEDSE